MELGGKKKDDELPDYRVRVHPRGSFNSRSASICGGDSFNTTRAFVTIDEPTVIGIGNVSVEGMNEDGLTISGHTLRQSVYQEGLVYPAATSKLRLCWVDVVYYILGNFGNVQDAVAALKADILVVAMKNIPFPSGIRLHWGIDDSSGNHVVIEYLGGNIQVHNNSVGVMTNDPDYVWHLRNLNNYVNLRSSLPDQQSIAVYTEEVGVVPSVVGHGFNLYGIPGDISPPSRFINLFYSKQYAILNHGVPNTLEDGISLVTGLLNRVWISKGIVARGPLELNSYEFTQYSVMKIPELRQFYFKSYQNNQWRLLSLAKLDWSKSAEIALRDGSTGIEDVTSQL